MSPSGNAPLPRPAAKTSTSAVHSETGRSTASPSPVAEAGTRLADVLSRAALAGMDPVDARILVAHALAWSRIELITRSDHALGSEEARRVEALLQRRLQGEPVAYLTGCREFYGLSLHVTPDVLIPRPETELLVDLALERLSQTVSGARVLDLGTGSGAIAVAIAQMRPDAQVTAVDRSQSALRVAEANARRHAGVGRGVVFLYSDWYQALGDAQYELIVSNPPYIASDDHHLSSGDLRFEPADALTDNGDGLCAFRSIVEGAPRHLVPQGWLLFEHGYDQAAAVRELLSAHRFADIQSWPDLAGIERVTGGRLA